MLFRMCMPLACLDFFYVLTPLFICALQNVSAPCLLGFFLCPNLSAHLCSPESECPLVSFFLNFDPPPLFRLCVPLEHLVIFSKLTCFSLVCLPECELISCISSPYAFSHVPFFASKALFSKLNSFCAKVHIFNFNFYRFIFALLTHFQPPLLISSDDHVHCTLIGTFLMSAFAISDIKNSINSHS